MPGEAERAAKYLGMTLTEFFKIYLGVNWLEGDDNIFLLAPATANMDPGGEYPGNPRGRCVFFENGLCNIHAVKPFECSEYIHGDTEVSARHRQVAQAWKAHQAQIVELLGREPEAEEYEGGGLFSSILGW